MVHSRHELGRRAWGLAWCAWVWCGLGAGHAQAQSPQPQPLAEWLASDPAFAELLAAPETYRLQVLVSEVVEDASGAPLVRHGYRVDAEYFYPASAIKLAAVFGLFRLLRDGEIAQPLAAEIAIGEQRVGVRRALERMLVVSSNDAFNLLYDVVGHETLHRTMWEAGLSSARLHHRLHTERSLEENRSAPSVVITPAAGAALVLPARTSPLAVGPHEATSVMIGEASVRDHEKIAGPMDFGGKNGLSLRDHQRMLIALVRPDLLDVEGFALDDGLTQSVLAIMGAAPSELGLEGDENRFKPMLPGLLRLAPRARFRYVNKAGRAYGFHVENAYIEDLESGRGFFVTATVYVNANRLLNDDRYEYKAVSYPFMADVGELLGRKVLGLAPL